MAVHVQDLVAVLDHVGCDRAVVAGHSMGGYVVTRFATDAPERMAGAVLVDGGLPLPVPPDVDPDVLLALVLGPSLARLEMTFPSVEAYRDFWRVHPAFVPGPWSDDVLDFIDYDLGQPETGAEGEPVYRSRVSKDAVRADGRDLLDSDSAVKSLQALVEPCALLWAPRGIQNEDRPLIPAEVIADARASLPYLAVTEIPDTNHYFALLGDEPAGVVAAEIRRIARTSGSS
jgi:pimeloyl-ACP methyl ester carboxylesterase